jgi:hypothetical protein
MKSLQIPSTKKTLKNRNSVKNDMWNIFDSEITLKTPIESLELDKDFCQNCNAILFISDEGFLTCSNSKCSIIYKKKILS